MLNRIRSAPSIFSLFSSKTTQSGQTTPTPSELESGENTSGVCSPRGTPQTPGSVARIWTPINSVPQSLPALSSWPQLQKCPKLYGNTEEYWALQLKDEPYRVPMGDYFFIEVKSTIYILSQKDESLFHQYLTVETMNDPSDQADVISYAGQICFADDYTGTITSCSHYYNAPNSPNPILPELTTPSPSTLTI